MSTFREDFKSPNKMENQNEAESHLQAGNAFYDQGNYTEACKEYQKATEVDSDHAIAYYNWGLALEKLERYDEAIKKYEEATNKDPSYVDAYRSWGLALVKLGRYDEAFKKYEEATNKKPDYADAYNDWGNALYDMKRYKEAIEKYKKALEIDDKYIHAYYNWGHILADLKRYEEAIEKYQKAIGVNDKYTDAYNGWGNALYKMKRYEEAIEKYKKASEIDDKYVRAYNNWGLALVKLGRYDEAIKKCEEATKKKPDYTDAYNNWGNTLLDLKKYDEAIEKYKKAIEADPNYVYAYRNWGLTLQKQGKYDEAIKKYEEATNKKPDYADPYNDWGTVLDAQKKYEEAIQQYQKAIEADSNYVYAYNNWGLVLGNLRRYEEAIEKFQEATQADFDYAYAYHNIAHYLSRQGKYKAAREKWEKTCEVYERTKEKAKDLNNAEHFFYYGSLLHEIFGELNKAEEIYNEGLKLDSNHIGILTGLVNLYLEKKDEDADEKTKPYWYPEKRNEDTDKSSAAHWKASEYYKKAEAILKDRLKKSEDVSTLLQLGELQLTTSTMEEEYEEAGKNLRKALEGDRESPTPYADLGVLYSRMEDFKKAVEHFETAFKQDPDDFTIRSNMAEAYFRLGKTERAESEYKKILGIAPYHVESLIGLGEVYNVLAEKDDPDRYYEAVSCFTNALKIASSENYSKRLKKKELAAVHYSRGYANSKLYESSKFRKDESLIKEALKDFKLCHKMDPNHHKAIRAVEKIEERIGGLYNPRLTEKVGPWAVFILSFLMFIGIQISFYIPIFSKPYVLITEESLANLEEIPDNILDSLNAIKNQKFISSGELLDFLKKSTGIELPKGLKSSILKQATTAKSLDNFPKFGPSSYALLSFASLVFMITGLYLPQILKLKVGAIELEKGAVDQIKTSGTLGISK